MPFTKFSFNDLLFQGIQAAGYTAPTPIQAQAIPVALAGTDLIACAQTGTGKTAAFVLPMLQQLTFRKNKPSKKQVHALILTPTRELALQVEAAIAEYGQFMKLRTLAIYGGVSIENQIKALQRGVDIAICTPGRLLDHMKRETIDLGQIQILVLDEADRMLDMGFVKDVYKIAKAIPSERQTMLFSATLSPEIKSLTESIQKEPQMIQVGKRHNPIDTITQHVYPVQQQQKIGLLLHMLESEHMDSVLIFTRTKHGADRLCWRLNKSDIATVAIHADRTQRQRIKALAGFKDGKFRIMVATDIAARGIDIEGISHVINYDVPAYAEDYIHRIGRTGRASSTGDAITFVAHEEHRHLKQIEKFIGRKFDMKTCDDFVYEFPIVPPATSSGEGAKKHSNRPGKYRFNKYQKSSAKPKNSSGNFSQRSGQTANKKSLGGNSSSRQSSFNGSKKFRRRSS